MADAPTLEQIEEEQKAIAVLTDELTKTSDPEKIEQLTAMIQQMAMALQEMCLAVEAAFKEAHPEAFDVNGNPIPAPEPRFEVLLTPAQRQRVHEKTGVDMPSVLIDDPTGMQNQQMTQTQLDTIEAIAMEKAIAFNTMAAAVEEAARQRAEAEAELPDEVREMMAAREDAGG